MPVIPKTSEQPDDPALRAIFDEVRGRIDRVPDLYRLIGHSPALLRAWIDFAWPLRLNAKTSRATRETATRCRWCSNSATPSGASTRFSWS